jgi:2-polyprenyl-6-methoxyphenol hydroxylase-like FAD-dependent oxidoreductase
VFERTGFVVPVETCVWMSPFGIEYRLAERFHERNLMLAGDAAHVVSPIGGQGMNLGFLDAGEIASIIPGLLNLPDVSTKGERKLPEEYGDVRRSAAKTALKRAEYNTILGRPCPAWHPNRALVWGIINVPWVRDYFVGNFTMRGLAGR